MTQRHFSEPISCVSAEDILKHDVQSDIDLAMTFRLSVASFSVLMLQLPDCKEVNYALRILW